MFDQTDIDRLEEALRPIRMELVEIRDKAEAALKISHEIIDNEVSALIRRLKKETEIGQ